MPDPFPNPVGRGSAADPYVYTLTTADAAALAAKAQALTPTAVKTAAYAAAAGDFVPVDTTAGAVTVTLPTAPADKTRIAIKHVIQGGTNAVTYACGGSDVLNKAAGVTSGTLTLSSQAALLQYKASGAIWYVQADDMPLSQLDTRFQATIPPGTYAKPATSGMLAARPAATVIGQRYKATDVNGGTLYESIDGSTWVQMAPGITEASAEATRATAAEGVNATNIATNTTAITSEASTARAAEALKAPLASPTFTGTAPVIPDAAAATHAMNRQSSDARLAPLVNRVVVPAGAMLAVSATATYAANVTPVWSMPASVSWVMAAIELPAHWATFKISVRYVNLVATAGNVVFRPDTNVSADGDTIARTQQSSVTDAAPAQNVPKTTQLYTGLSVAAAGLGVHAITVNRLGGSGADTLAGAIGLLSLIFEKVTP